jgi:hypothetical protein
MIMVFKLIQTAQSSWRRLDGQNQLPKLITGVKFTTVSKPAVKTPPPDPGHTRHQDSRIPRERLRASRTKRTRLPSASVSAKIFVVRPPLDFPMAWL